MSISHTHIAIAKNDWATSKANPKANPEPGPKANPEPGTPVSPALMRRGLDSSWCPSFRAALSDLALSREAGTQGTAAAAPILGDPS